MPMVVLTYVFHLMQCRGHLGPGVCGGQVPSTLGSCTLVMFIQFIFIEHLLCVRPCGSTGIRLCAGQPGFLPVHGLWGRQDSSL